MLVDLIRERERESQQERERTCREEKMNTKNPAIKRIAADIKELKSHPSSRYHAMPLEEDMFEWHFTIRGPEDTPFSGGIYHGRILLPPEYPFKPPNIIFLTVLIF